MSKINTGKTELLAPAGSFETLKAVVNAGADAVYCAGNRFGARAYANNFTEEEMIFAIDFMHIKGKKLYMTVNTLLKEKELEEELYSYLRPYYEAGLDAVIVQDLGVMHFIKEHFPGLHIHASTQMTITGAYGAELMLNAGCSRIVTARELSLQEIQDIYEKTGAEIESFVHGALCYGYSGQCLLSSMIGGRSGNRGRCAQPCRLPYELFEDKQKGISSKNKKEAYLLSPKDLCTIDLIPELIGHGVHSFKIEGRMKQAEYAAGVTSIYRYYIDKYESNPKAPYQVSQEDKQKLWDLGNRCGFTDGYYKRHNGKEMITFEKPSHEKGNEKLQQQIRQTYMEKEEKEKINGILILSKEFPAKLVLEYKGVKTEVMGDTVQKAQKQPMSKETILDKMRKTGNTPFVFETLSVEMEEDIFIPVGALNQLRRDGLEQLEQNILGAYKRILSKEQYQKEQQTPKSSEKAWKPQLRVMVEEREQFFVALKQAEIRRIYMDVFKVTPQDIIAARECGKELYLALPYILRKNVAEQLQQVFTKLSEQNPDGYLVRNLEEICFLQKRKVEGKKIQTDYGVYVFSNEARKALEEWGIEHFTLPVELNRSELFDLTCEKGEMILYGHQPLMISAGCLHKNTAGCDRTPGTFYLKDRYAKIFPVKNKCRECYNVIYNTSPLCLLHHQRELQRLAPEAVRLHFTIENEQKMEQVFSLYRQAFWEKKKILPEQYFKDYTNGHFKRGVE